MCELIEKGLFKAQGLKINSFSNDFKNIYHAYFAQYFSNTPSFVREFLNKSVWFLLFKKKLTQLYSILKIGNSNVSNQDSCNVATYYRC